LLNQTCYGYDLSSINVEKVTGNTIYLKWLIDAYKMYPKKDEFFLASGFFNKLAGNDILMQQIKDGKSIVEIRASWKPGIDNFMKIRNKYLMYE